MKKYLLGIALLAAAPVLASTQATPCAAPNGGNSGGEGVNGSYVTNQAATLGATGCNVLITFNANGSVSTSAPNAAISYDAGLDDNIVGIINNSGHTITSLTFTGTSDAFGFDGDGACGGPGYTFNSQGPGGSTLAGACGTVDSTGYGDNGITFTAISGGGNNGTVNFGSGIANGSAAWFSLEGPVDLNIAAHLTPEPGTLVLFGSGLIGLAGVLRRKLIK